MHLVINNENKIIFNHDMILLICRKHLIKGAIKVQKIENIIETNQFETETIKKSSLTAEDTFDYQK